MIENAQSSASNRRNLGILKNKLKDTPNLDKIYRCQEIELIENTIEYFDKAKRRIGGINKWQYICMK